MVYYVTMINLDGNMLYYTLTHGQGLSPLQLLRSPTLPGIFGSGGTCEGRFVENLRRSVQKASVTGMDMGL